MKITYEPELTALVVVDPYNDFMSKGGKLWLRCQAIAEEVGCIENMR